MFLRLFQWLCATGWWWTTAAKTATPQNLAASGETPMSLPAAPSASSLLLPWPLCPTPVVGVIGFATAIPIPAACFPKEFRYSRTLLLLAAQRGRDATIKLLLVTRKVDVDLKGMDGRMPLSWTARNGHKAAVSILLEKNSNIDAMHSSGQTALSWGAQNGHDAVVKLLLDSRNVDVDTEHADGQTPLWRVAENRLHAAVKLLEWILSAL